VNIYRVEFFAKCPVNGIRIKYLLRIETTRVIRVESLLAAAEDIGGGYHEAIADDLASLFPGRQTLTAEHHGVHIETTRGAE